MKGIRFYEELENKNRKAEKSRGTVLAVFYEAGLHTSSSHWCWEALGGLFNEPNSPACSVSPSREYLRENCKRISEAKAREIHPLLFERLDD